MVIPGSECKDKTSSEEIALLGQKMALLKTLNYLQDELHKINDKLIKIDKRKMFKVLKGKK